MMIQYKVQVLLIWSEADYAHQDFCHFLCCMSELHRLRTGNNSRQVDKKFLTGICLRAKTWNIHVSADAANSRLYCNLQGCTWREKEQRLLHWHYCCRWIFCKFLLLHLTPAISYTSGMLLSKVIDHSRHISLQFFLSRICYGWKSPHIMFRHVVQN